MGAVLVITRIVYYALNRIDELPPALEVPENVRERQNQANKEKERE